MLRRLKLRNYRQHEDTVLEFVQGVNTIVGANGAGKSTLPEAIEFALFGAKALRDTGTAWITDGQKAGSAVLTLDIKDVVYKVGRNATAAKVMDENNETLADYKANVTKYVGQLTGVNHAGFRLGHYVRQKELAAFSQLRAGKRQETIEKMLKINAVDRVLTLLKADADALDAKLKVLLSTAQDADALAEELMGLEMERAALQPIDVVPLETTVTADRKALGAVREKLAGLKAQREELAELRETLKDFAAAEADLSAANDELRSFVPRCVESLENLQRKLKELQKSEVLKAKMSSIEAELNRELPVVTQPTKPDSTAADAATAAISVADGNLKTVSKLKGLTKCPTCLTEIADVDAVIASLTEALDKARQDGKEPVRLYAEASAEFAKNDRAYSVYQAELKRRATLQTQLVNVEFSEDEKKQVEKEIAAVTEDNRTHERLSRNVEVLRTKVNALTRAAARRDELEKTFCETSLNDAESEAARLAETLGLKEEELQDTKKRATEVTKAIAKLDGRIQELRKQVESAQTLRVTITDTADRVAVLKYRHDLYQKFKKYLTAKIRPMIGNVAEALFHRVTKNRFASYQLSNDYEVILNTHQGYVRKLSTISGSENDLANLCLRLAIATLRSNRLVGNLGFIILDEISSSFDDDRTKQTLEGLLELKDVIPQIINITHKPVEVRYADRLFTVKEFNGRSSVTMS